MIGLALRTSPVSLASAEPIRELRVMVGPEEKKTERSMWQLDGSRMV